MTDTITTPEPPAPNCGSCLFWLQLTGLDPSGDLGECHRWAPSATTTPADALPQGRTRRLVAVWPGTTVTDRCGEHQRRYDT